MPGRDPQYDGTAFSGAHIGDPAHDHLVGKGERDWLFLSAHELAGVSGTWTPSYASDVPVNTRSAGAATEVATFDLGKVLGIDTRARRRRIKALKLAYSVDTADLTDLELELIKVNDNGNGSAPDAEVVGGDADSHYDTDHNSAAKRGLDAGGPEEHTLLMTVPSTSRFSLDDAAGAVARLTVQDPGTSVLVVKGLWVQLDHRPGRR